MAKLLLLALVCLAVAAPATAANQPVVVTPGEGQLRWGQTVAFDVTLQNPLDFDWTGFSAEVVNTVDRRWVPIRATISPVPSFIGPTGVFWALPTLAGNQSVSYRVTVRLPAIGGRHEYCFAANMYLLPTATWGWPWSDSGWFCASVN